MNNENDTREWYDKHPILAVFVVIAITVVGAYLFSQGVGSGGGCNRYDSQCQGQEEGTSQQAEDVEQYENEQKVKEFYREGAQ